MRGLPVQIGAGAALLLAAVCCLGDLGTLTAVLLPILAHELGHLLALWLLRMPVRRFRVELRGFCIEYGGAAGALAHSFIAAAGPLAGLIYALLCSHYARETGSDWLCLTAGVSLVLSGFNLLPALPLDGGCILLRLSGAVLGEKRGRLVTEVCGLLVASGMLGGGLYLLSQGRGAALLVAALWLLFSQDAGEGLVKAREIL